MEHSVGTGGTSGNRMEEHNICDKEDASDDTAGDYPDGITSNSIGDNVGYNAADNGGYNVVKNPTNSEENIGGSITEESIVKITEDVSSNESKKFFSNNTRKSEMIDAGEVGGDNTHEKIRQHKKTSKRKLKEVGCLQMAWQDMMTSHPKHDVATDGVNKDHDKVTDDDGDGREDTSDEDTGSGDDGTPETRSDEDPDVADDGAGSEGQDTGLEEATGEGNTGGVERVQKPGRDSGRSLESGDVTKGKTAAPPFGCSGPGPHPTEGSADPEAPPHPTTAAETRDDVSSPNQRSKVKVDLEVNKGASLEGLAACKAKFASHYASITRKRMNMNRAGRESAAIVVQEEREEEEARMRRRCRQLRAELAQEELDLLHHLQGLQRQKLNLQRAIIDLETSVNSTREPNDKVDIEAFLRMQNCSRECQEIARELKGNPSPLCPPKSTEQDLEGCPASDDPFASVDRVPAVVYPVLGEPDPKDSFSIYLPGMKKESPGLDECSKTRRGNFAPRERSGRCLKSTESRPRQIRKQTLGTPNDQKGGNFFMLKESDQPAKQNNPYPADLNTKSKVRRKKNRTTKIEATSVGLLRNDTFGEPITKSSSDSTSLQDSVDIDHVNSFKTGAKISVKEVPGSEQFLDVQKKGARKARVVGARTTRHERRRREAAESSDGVIQSVISSNIPGSDEE